MCFVFAYRVTGESVGNKKSQLKKLWLNVNTVREKDTPKHTLPYSIIFLLRHACFYLFFYFFSFLFVFVFHKAPKGKLI